MDKIDALFIVRPGAYYANQFLECCCRNDLARTRVEWRLIDPAEITPDDLKRPEIIVCTYFDPAWVQFAEHLRWIQFTGAGVEGSLSPELLATDIILTNASGIHTVPISEHVLGMMLMFARDLQRCVRRQVRHQWDGDETGRITEICSSTIGIIGLGAIGTGIAEKSKALGMRVIATKRHPSKSDVVDMMLPPAELEVLLRESDYIIISTPLTDETRGMIGEAQFKLMKPNTVLINIARGAIVDQNALVRALQEGRIGGAGLDVTEPEPLPEDSPLWDMPNVIISPHISGLTPFYGRRLADIFLHNLPAFLENDTRKMMNLVDKQLGY